jgi:hypothetical protein
MQGIVAEDGGPAPSIGGVEDSLHIERASATPIVPAKSAEVASGEPSPVADAPLDVLQRWFAGAVMRREAVDAQAVLTRGPRLTAAERLGIYRYAYRARLVECLADDYPVLEKTIGRERFETLADAYIEAHPSTHPNLNCFGLRFASFLDARGERFASDLARLEWAMVEVVHAKEPMPLPVAELEALSPDQWPTVRLSPSPTLRFLEFAHPVNRHLQDIREGRAASVPSPSWSATAVYRQRYVIWRMDFTRAMADVLSALIDGRTLGEALDALESHAIVEGDVMAWFRAWVSSGFFERIAI